MKEKDLPIFNDFDNTGWDVHYKKNKYILIKKGDVEMIAAVVLKNTRKAGAFRNIKIK